MEKRSFCDGWEFSREGEPFERVVVPHDAMLGNRRDAQAPAGSASGYFHGASYRYRKHFDITGKQAAGMLFLEFEGIYRDACITVNGSPLEASPYGFIPFIVDISGVVREGSNTIEIEASNADQPDCRWYSGGGLYRPVWLWEAGGSHIAAEGVRVTTLSIDPARIHVEIEADGGTPAVDILDPSGEIVASGTGQSLDLEIENACLWCADDPNLYRCSVRLLDNDLVVDVSETVFGIRLLEWSSKGLFVNGRETLLRGGCIHCDNGVLGAASFAASEYRRIRLLKEAGFNAVRIAHNPAPSSLLDACDEIGMYVMDETWDMWFMRKSAHDYANTFLDWCDYDLARLVAHDYNHPSVIMYSIGNEIADPIQPEGVAIERSLVDLLHSLDPTRPVTCGFNLTMMVMERMGQGWYTSGDGVAQGAQSPTDPPRGSLMFNLSAQALGAGMTYIANAPGADRLVSPALDALDIAGYNYASARYPIDVRKHPARIIVGSETFPHELARNWRMVERYPALIGDFMWAGWDYLGEAGAGAWAYTAEEAGFSKPWPWLIAGSGALDILGNPGAPAALAAAVWKTRKGPMIMVRPVNMMDRKTYRATWRGSDAIPSWSWAGCEGMNAQVEVYDGFASAMRLELNGEVVDTKRVHGCVARFSLTYAPGMITAVALDAAGREMGRASLASATGHIHLRVSPESTCNEAGDVASVALAIEGENNVVESNSDELVHVSVENGELLAFGSARPATTERFTTGSYTTYRGQALAIVYRSTPGCATLTASCSSLPPASASIAFTPAHRESGPFGVRR